MNFKVSRAHSAYFCICLSSFEFGYALSSLNTSLSRQGTGSIFIDFPDLSHGFIELLQAALICGAWFGSLTSGRFAESWGRRRSLLVCDYLFIMGALLQSIAVSPIALVVGRVVVGLAVGCSTGVAPVLLAELAPPSVRGSIVGMHQLALTLGIAFSGVGGGLVVANVPGGWRLVQAWIAVPALMQLVFSKRIPESPQWLASRGMAPAAKAILINLRGDVSAAELDSLGNSSSSGRGFEAEDPTWCEVFSHGRAMGVGSGMMFFSAVTGINTVILYSTTIFAMAGFPKADMAATAIVTLVNVLVTVLALVLVDRMGRRPLLLRGTGVMAASLLGLSFSLKYLNHFPFIQGLFALLFTLMFIAGFAVGLGAVGWVVASEQVPGRIRGKAFGFFVSVNWFCNLIIGLSTLSLIDYFGGVNEAGGDDDLGRKKGVATLYAIFSVISLVAFAFIHSMVPETKGTALDDACVRRELELESTSRLMANP
jgi:sugar porter (SP) family MFS transporter